jgi:hypothetical protein
LDHLSGEIYANFCLNYRPNDVKYFQGTSSISKYLRIRPEILRMHPITTTVKPRYRISPWEKATWNATSEKITEAISPSCDERFLEYVERSKLVKTVTNASLSAIVIDQIKVLPSIKTAGQPTGIESGKYQ